MYVPEGYIGVLSGFEMEGRIHQMVLNTVLDIGQRKGWIPDMVIGLMSGGIPMMSEVCSRLADRRIFPQLGYADIHRIEAAPSRFEIPTDRTWMSFSLPDLFGRNVLVVDDVFDSGVTIQKMEYYLGLAKAKEVRYMMGVDKGDPANEFYRQIKPRMMAALTVPHDFGWLIGFGMDAADGRYRNLHGIAVKEGSGTYAGTAGFGTKLGHPGTKAGASVR